MAKDLACAVESSADDGRARAASLYTSKSRVSLAVVESRHYGSDLPSPLRIRWRLTEELVLRGLQHITLFKQRKSELSHCARIAFELTQ